MHIYFRDFEKLLLRNIRNEAMRIFKKESFI